MLSRYARGGCQVPQKSTGWSYESSSDLDLFRTGFLTDKGDPSWNGPVGQHLAFELQRALAAVRFVDQPVIVLRAVRRLCGTGRLGCKVGWGLEDQQPVPQSGRASASGRAPGRPGEAEP